MAWTTMPKLRPLLPMCYEWLNIFFDNLQHLYDTIHSKSLAIPEPTRFDKYEWDTFWEWEDIDEKGIEYSMMYQADKRWLWYRYALRDGEEPTDLPHITFGFDWGSPRHEDGFMLNTDNGGDEWNVQDLEQIATLIPGMIISVHTVRCALLRNVSE